jgi:hypothetical protein
MGDVTDIRRQAVSAEESAEFFIELDTLVTKYMEKGLDLSQIVMYLQVINVSIVSEMAQAIYGDDE